ncbi:unnamed protein product [Prorocentrum cordatum]|uniref:Alpha-1,6-mannosyl-glycoprotein 6-beta-N-acetylglucosaminyltransferase n=1 Tax=Prorocentrum cordatum TaxID=2364126 RepID=A0ABN9XPF3_9DINO|nr:unnamed protein product [Polarella glacialis]
MPREASRGTARRQPRRLPLPLLLAAAHIRPGGAARARRGVPRQAAIRAGLEQAALPVEPCDEPKNSSEMARGLLQEALGRRTSPDRRPVHGPAAQPARLSMDVPEEHPARRRGAPGAGAAGATRLHLAGAASSGQQGRDKVTTWILSGGGESCDEACSASGSSCDASADWPTTEAAVSIVSSLLGHSCDQYTNYGGDWEFAPYTYTPDGRCNYPTSATYPTCSAAGADANFRRFCPCTPTVQVTTWILSGGGESCDEACSASGSSCDASADWPTTEAAVSIVGSLLGHSCDQYTNYGGDWEFAPYTYTPDGRCNYPTSATYPTCSAAGADANFRRFCPCTPTVQVNDTETSSLHVALHHGSVMSLKSTGYGAYLDVRGSGCEENEACVSGSASLERSNPAEYTGEWKMLRTGGPGIIVDGDPVYLQSMYGSQPLYLDTRGEGCEDNELCVSASSSKEGSVPGNHSTEWIVRRVEGAGDLMTGDSIHLQSMMGDVTAYLDVRGTGCEDNEYCVSAASSSTRDGHSGTWQVLLKQAVVQSELSETTDDAKATATCPENTWVMSCEPIGATAGDQGDGLQLSEDGASCTAVNSGTGQGIRARATCTGAPTVSSVSGELFLDHQEVTAACDHGAALWCTCHSPWAVPGACGGESSFAPAGGVCSKEVGSSGGRRRGTGFGAGAKLYALCLPPPAPAPAAGVLPRMRRVVHTQSAGGGPAV